MVPLQHPLSPTVSRTCLHLCLICSETFEPGVAGRHDTFTCVLVSWRRCYLRVHCPPPRARMFEDIFTRFSSGLGPWRKTWRHKGAIRERGGVHFEFLATVIDYTTYPGEVGWGEVSGKFLTTIIAYSSRDKVSSIHNGQRGGCILGR